MEIPLHAGFYLPKGFKVYLFLYHDQEKKFRWFETDFKELKPLQCASDSLRGALSKANEHFKTDFFEFLKCGFRYQLPERDEVGCNALFWQMAESYSHPLGYYFDKELRSQQYVDFASQEALDIWRKVR